MVAARASQQVESCTSIELLSHIFEMISRKIRVLTHFSLLSLSLILAACGGGGNNAGAPVTPVPVPVPVSPSPTEMHILIIGQSISSNCNEHIYGPVDNVSQIDKSGNIVAAKDPFDWADCSKGSMWMPLGRKIIESGIVQKVVFMPIGVDSSHVQDWQEGGSAFGKLNAAIALIKEKNIKFDFVFWHQGSSDIGMSRDEYFSRLSSVATYVNANLQVGGWIVAQHSRCFGRYDEGIEAAQKMFGDSPSNKRYLGPNNNLLGDEFRFDSCHLNQKGQEEMASLWLASIRKASGK
jgi:hypothetical protein